MISPEFKEEYPLYRSDEEVFFHWYLEDLIEAGFIDKWNYEEETYELFDQVKIPWMEQMKTMVKQREFEALKPSKYTPDFNFYWNEKAKGVFVGGMPTIVKPFFAGSEFLNFTDQPKSVIDVKGSSKSKGKKNSSAITFPLKQKFMWMVHNIFVHKVVPQEIFEKTFTPHRYLYTNKSGAKRKIKWKVRSVYEYEKYMVEGHKTKKSTPQTNLF